MRVTISYMKMKEKLKKKRGKKSEGPCCLGCLPYFPLPQYLVSAAWVPQLHSKPNSSSSRSLSWRYSILGSGLVMKNDQKLREKVKITELLRFEGTAIQRFSYRLDSQFSFPLLI